MYKLKPKDMIATLTLFLVAGLKFTGHDGSLDAALALILGYYFAHRLHGKDEGQ